MADNLLRQTAESFVFEQSECVQFLWMKFVALIMTVLLVCMLCSM